MDVQSFREGIGDASITASSFAPPGTEVRDVPSSEVYLCSAGREFEECSTRHDGIHARLRRAHRTADSLEVDVSWSWRTTGHADGTHAGAFGERYVFDREDGAWVLRRTEWLFVN